MDTFGENKTYMNQVFLMEFNPLNLKEASEDEAEHNDSRIFEEHSKYADSEGSKTSSQHEKRVGHATPAIDFEDQRKSLQETF